MHFFLYEILGRIVAIYLFFDCARELRRGLVEGKIRFFNPSLLIWRTWIFQRDANPVQYRIQIGVHIIILAACAFVAIFGWWDSNALPDQAGH